MHFRLYKVLLFNALVVFIVCIRSPGGIANGKNAIICIYYCSHCVPILLHICIIIAGTFLIPQSKFKEVDHSYILYMNWILDEILKEVRHPCAEETDESLLQKYDQLEKRVEDALNDIRTDISVHTNSLHGIKQDLNEKSASRDDKIP